MSKRFVDTEMMLKPWFRSLSPRLKLLWFWMLARCDMCGFLDMDFELASFAIGEKVSAVDLQKMNGNVVVIDGTKVFIPEFIDFQYGELSDESRVHKGILKCLTGHGLKYPLALNEYPYLTLLGVADTPKDKDKVKDKVKDKANTRGKSMEPKTAFGEFGRVKLTATEADKLRESYGVDFDKAINILDAYMESKGKHYDSCYAAMKHDGWVWEKVHTGKGGKPAPVSEPFHGNPEPYV